MTIPITPSEAVLFRTESEIENVYLTGETATLTEVSVGASNIALTYEVKLFQDLCDEYGGGVDGWFAIGDAYEGYYRELSGQARRTEYTELDAQVAYGRSWSASVNQLLETAYLTLTDGTEISLSGLQHADVDTEPEECTWSQRFELPSAVSLSQVASLTIGGQTYTAE